MVSILTVVLFASSMVTSGAFISIFGKVMYQTSSTNIDGNSQKFEKPWFEDWAMFVGMVAVFIPEGIRRVFARVKRSRDPINAAYEKTTTNTKGGKKKFLVMVLKIAIPAVCDSIATILMNVALLWLDASIWQMMRGSIIIFTAILTIFWRKRKLFRNEWIGMVCVVVAIATLGVVALMNEKYYPDTKEDEPVSQPAWKIILALILLLLSMAIQALQTVVEEKFLQDATAPPMTIVAFEGLWGFLFCSLIFMPIAQFLPGDEGNGFHEDTISSFVMLGNSWVLLLVTFGYAFGIMLYNIFGMYVTDVTNALTRNVMDPLRTLLVWIMSLFIYYVISKNVGEKWTPWSFLELGGFLIMSVGVLTFNGVFTCHCIMGEHPKEEKPVEEEGHAFNCDGKIEDVENNSRLLDNVYN